jgi:hypothetical protein
MEEREREREREKWVRRHCFCPSFLPSIRHSSKLLNCTKNHLSPRRPRKTVWRGGREPFFFLFLICSATNSDRNCLFRETRATQNLRQTEETEKMELELRLLLLSDRRLPRRKPSDVEEEIQVQHKWLLYGLSESRISQRG